MGLKTKHLISSTDAHEDFVKALYVFPSLGLLVSGSSDKFVRFWFSSNFLFSPCVMGSHLGFLFIYLPGMSLRQWKRDH